MGKKTEKPAEVSEPVAESVAAVPAGPKRFRVTLAAPTPITFNNVEIEADSVADAKAKFCAMNGIDSSTQPWTVTEL